MSSEILVNDINEIHRCMLRDIALNVEILLNLKDHDISEYDVQAMMAQFLKRYPEKIGVEIFREGFGKFDCGLMDAKTRKPLILYELKTYVKSHENFYTKTALRNIRKDIKKLWDSISKYESVRPYFVMICKQKDLKKLETKSLKVEGFDFIYQLHVKKSKKWIRIEDEGVRLRPSAQVRVNRTYVFSWEVKPIK